MAVLILRDLRLPDFRDYAVQVTVLGAVSATTIFMYAATKKEGATSTPFDMCVLNDLDRFHLVSDVIDRVPKLRARAAYAKQAIRNKLIDHKQYIAS